MTTPTNQPTPPQADTPDYEGIAIEMAGLMASLLLKLRPTSDWLGLMVDGETGERYTWEEAVARLIDKVPGISVDRRFLEAKQLPAKERRKRYHELHNEKQANRTEAA